MAADDYIPTDDDVSLVKDLLTLGCPEERIARHLGISLRTLKAHYGRELALGSDLTNREVMLQLYRRCMNGDTKAIIFWLKSRAGWVEAKPEEAATPDKGDERVPFNVVLRNQDGQDEIVVSAADFKAH